MTSKDLDKAALTLAERMYKSVLPIIGADERGRYDAIGSGVLIAFGARCFLATAKHVLDHNDEKGSSNPLWEPTTLYVGVPGGTQVKLLGEAAKAADPADVALVALSDETISGLGECHFLDGEHEISASSFTSKFAVAMGYQNRSPEIDEAQKSVKHEPLIFSNSGSRRDQIHILMPLDWKKVRDGAQLRSIGKLQGISGGGLFWLRSLTEPGSTDILAGIMIEHKDKTLKATDANVLRRLLQEL